MTWPLSTPIDLITCEKITSFIGLLSIGRRVWILENTSLFTLKDQKFWYCLKLKPNLKHILIQHSLIADIDFCIVISCGLEKTLLKWRKSDQRSRTFGDFVMPIRLTQRNEEGVVYFKTENKVKDNRHDFIYQFGQKTHTTSITLNSRSKPQKRQNLVISTFSQQQRHL